MKILGLDYGQRRVGVALSDRGAAFSFPHTTLPNDSKLIKELKKLIDSEDVGMVVVGDARSYSGRSNAITGEVERFIDVLKKETGLPVEAVFEAGSSVEASRFAQKSEAHNDAAAAAVILQRYLDARK